jgi:hypothetical protein
MTVQTQGQQAYGAVRPISVRGLKKWAIGVAAIAAAATGIGVGVAVSADTERATVIAPAASDATAPQHEQRDALKRLEENTQTAQDRARDEAYRRLEGATWAK